MLSPLKLIPMKDQVSMLFVERGQIAGTPGAYQHIAYLAVIHLGHCLPGKSRRPTTPGNAPNVRFA